MSEMLANQYFLARKFDKAVPHLESVIRNEPHNERARKKLIICYCETGHVRSALELFYNVIQSNIKLIVDTDIISEDCPCPELLERMKWYEEVAVNSFDFFCIMGMLHLYCDINDSLNAFNRAVEINSDDKLVQDIHDLIAEYDSVQSKETQ
jgi:hypothetical protein